MALIERGEHFYGDDQADIRAELVRYSGVAGYPVQHFADAVCVCGGRRFRVALDDDAGVAIRTCAACAVAHPIGDSADFLDDAEPEECACACDNEELEVTIGVSLYTDSDDVRWLYVGCRCPACGLTAVYGDWKNEFGGYRELLAAV